MLVSVSFYLISGQNFISSIKDTTVTTAAAELILRTIIESFLTLKNVLRTKTIGPINIY